MLPADVRVRANMWYGGAYPHKGAHMPASVCLTRTVVLIPAAILQDLQGFKWRPETGLDIRGAGAHHYACLSFLLKIKNSPLRLRNRKAGAVVTYYKAS